MSLFSSDDINVEELFIDEKQFLKLPIKQQNCVLYQNQVKTLKLLNAQCKRYDKVKFTQKVQYLVISAVGFMCLLLLKIQLGL